MPTAVEGHSGGGGGAASGWRRKEQAAALPCSRPWRTCASARSGAEQGDNEREEENGESRGQGSGFQGERARCRGAHAGEREATRQRLAVLGRPLPLLSSSKSEGATNTTANKRLKLDFLPFITLHLINDLINRLHCLLELSVYYNIS